MFIKLKSDTYLRLDQIVRFTLSRSDSNSVVIITTTNGLFIDVYENALDLYERLKKAFNIVE